MIKKIIFLIFLLFLTMAAVSAHESNDTIISAEDSVQFENQDNTLAVESADMSDKSNVQTQTSSNSTSKVTKSQIRCTSNKVVSTYGKKATFSVKVADNNGKVLKNKLVNFKVAGKTYNVYSDSNGIASIKLKLNAGIYPVTYSCEGETGENTITFKNSYKMTIYKWKSGANVKKNKKIKANIPNSNLVKKIVEAAKKGTPMIKFQGGSGKKVFITAGVHGNEISSQIAAMNLIQYLEDHPIKGTVYIMPFINPKATAKNVRNYNGVNLNSKANVKGTISYKTVNLIKKFKCDAYGDFHCTKPGGKPGKDVAMGTYKPTYKSSTMAKFIAKTSKVKYLIYKKAGTEYPGALEDMVSLNHIPAVTCEVITPHGKIAEGSVEKSLSMMQSLLQFNGLI